MEDEWTKVISGDRLVKFTYADLPGGEAFLTAQIAGHPVVYSVLLPHAGVEHHLVIPAKADDMKTDPAGNAGDRIARGTIPKYCQRPRDATPRRSMADEFTASPGRL
jgi:hypothetical protein